MISVSNLSKLLDNVERGEEIIITRYGQKVARPIYSERNNYLPSMKDFRASLKVAGQPLIKIADPPLEKTKPFSDRLSVHEKINLQFWKLRRLSGKTRKVS